MLPLPGRDRTISLPGLLCPRGTHPGLSDGPCQTALMPSLSPPTEWEGALAEPAPFQHTPVRVAPGTVARWHSLERSHPSPKALLASHQPRIRPQPAPCSARAVTLGTRSTFLPGCGPPQRRNVSGHSPHPGYNAVFFFP